MAFWHQFRELELGFKEIKCVVCILLTHCEVTANSSCPLGRLTQHWHQVGSGGEKAEMCRARSWCIDLLCNYEMCKIARRGSDSCQGPVKMQILSYQIRQTNIHNIPLRWDSNDKLVNGCCQFKDLRLVTAPKNLKCSEIFQLSNERNLIEIFTIWRKKNPTSLHITSNEIGSWNFPNHK